MQNRQSMFNIKNALMSELAAALNTPTISLQIEISEVNADNSYSVKGNFKIIGFLSDVIKRTGKFETTLDQNLKVISLKIIDEK